METELLIPESEKALPRAQIHTAYMTRKEYDELLRANPDDAAFVGPLAGFFGNTVEIHFTAGIRDLVGAATLDQLYWMANRITDDKFLSYYHQIEELVRLPRSRVDTVLEVGAKGGIFRSLAANYGYRITTLDIDGRNGPTLVGDVRRLPLATRSVDAAVCFEVLEHLPYAFFPAAVSELARVARNYVFISLPYQCNAIHFQFRSRVIESGMQRLTRNFAFSRQFRSSAKDIDPAKLAGRDGTHHPHFWELGRKSYPVERILADLEGAGLSVRKRFHAPNKPYHYFILCEVAGKKGKA